MHQIAASLAPVVAVFSSYSQSPFWVTTVAENGDKLWVWERQKLFDSVRIFQILCPLFDSSRFEMENHYSHSVTTGWRKNVL